MVPVAGKRMFKSRGGFYMKLIVGLGNPGTKYQNNRHNAGHLFIDFIDSQGLALRGYFFKTDVFMNDSGKFVTEKTNFFKISPDDLYIAHDDLDIPLGQYKIQLGVGPKVHNGVNNVEEVLGTKDFWRIRIGVDNRDSQNRMPGEDYVLQDFTKDELEILKLVQDDIYAELKKRFSQG